MFSLSNLTIPLAVESSLQVNSSKIGIQIFNMLRGLEESLARKAIEMKNL